MIRFPSSEWILRGLITLQSTKYPSNEPFFSQQKNNDSTAFVHLTQFIILIGWLARQHGKCHDLLFCSRAEVENSTTPLFHTHLIWLCHFHLLLLPRLHLIHSSPVLPCLIVTTPFLTLQHILWLDLLYWFWPCLPCSVLLRFCPGKSDNLLPPIKFCHVFIWTIACLWQWGVFCIPQRPMITSLLLPTSI